MNKYIIISSAVDSICNALKKLDFNLIESDVIDEFIEYERKHADMQCLSVDDKIFVLQNAKNLYNKLKEQNLDITKTAILAKGKYPDNILLNALFISDKLIGKIDSLDKNLVKYAILSGYELINENQGYTACSCCKISENAVITTDTSIAKTLESINIDVLKIKNENIILADAKRGECGFIGGASTKLDENTVLFFGDITMHQDYSLIKDFFKKHNKTYKYIKGIQLTDVGGAILLNF